MVTLLLPRPEAREKFSPVFPLRINQALRDKTNESVVVPMTEFLSLRFVLTESTAIYQLQFRFSYPALVLLKVCAFEFLLW